MKRLRQAVMVGLLCGLALSPVASVVTGVPYARAARQLIDVNTASAEQLELLPGIGPAKAQAIIEHRDKSPFTSLDELRQVRGIGDKVLETLRQHVTVGPAGP